MAKNGSFAQKGNFDDAAAKRYMKFCERSQFQGVIVCNSDCSEMA